jgi:hypothetical protein
MADLLTGLSLVSGGGAVFATARGATGLAGVLARTAGIAEISSNLFSQDYMKLLSDTVTNAGFSRLQDFAPSRGIKTAIGVLDLATDVADALPSPVMPQSQIERQQRITEQRALLSDRDWALAQGLNPLVVKGARPSLPTEP